ncbi:MAG: hypothetical protein PHZ04_03415 [Patescibacteria group bacterium]|nr:hypothetical protein [Patescibacteria group bacterium]MDD5294955.1 hypothetical protein [Patescibacteria group bacterium]MDD5554221.1 hypothetical protein [Patescibacteria group bacterium]
MKSILKIKKNKKGIALLVTVLLMALILFSSLYFLNFSLTEKKISHSQAWGEKTYYLAEAGVAEMVWRLKNDDNYKSNFEADPDWTANFTRDDPFGAGSGSYTVTITNSSQAHGEIVSVGAIDIGGGKASQRMIKTTVYKALGESGVEDSAAYADGDINISASMVNFYNGSAHSNNVFTVNLFSDISVDSDLRAVGNYILSWTSTADIAGNIYAHNFPPEAAEIPMPAIDFESDSPNSYKNRADVVYTSAEFDDLMEDNQNLTLNDPITYVDGDVDLRGGQTLTVNGLLVVGRDFIVGNGYCFGKSRCGQSSVVVNHSEGEPSGILAERKIYFKTWAGNIDINGLVYANDQLDILSFPFGFSFDVIGGLISRKLTITSVWEPINITHNNDYLMEVLGAAEFSPVITVEHWEEEY